MRIAIIRLSSLGDVISSAVFLKFIKDEFTKKYGKVHITFIVDASFKEILENSPYIDDICDIPLRKSKKNKKNIFDVFSKLRSLQYFDIVIDFQGLLKSAIIGKILKTNEFIGYSKDSAREKIASFFYTKKVHIAYKEHILKRQYEILKNILDLDSTFSFDLLDNREGILKSSNTAQSKIDNFIDSNNINILFVAEASKAEKEYSLDLFYRLAIALKSNINNLKIYLIWDKKEKEIRELGARDDVFYVCDKLNFDEIKALLSKLNLVIGGDTGITHLAWALNTSSITLYGNTPLKRYELCGDKFISMSHLNTNEIIKGDFSINKIQPDEIAKSAILLLEKK